jgi:hypothetical protein
MIIFGLTADVNFRIMNIYFPIQKVKVGISSEL